MISEFIMFLFVSFVLWKLLQKTRSRSNLPGPSTWNLLQNIGKFMKAPHKVCSDWSKEYGDFFQISFLGKRLIITNSAEIAAEAFNNPAIFKEQASHSAFAVYSGGDYGIGCCASSSWPEVRKFSVKMLHDSVHRNSDSSEVPTMSLAMKEMMSMIAATKGQPVSVQKFCTIPIFNIMWLLTGGKRLTEKEAVIVRKFHQHMGAYQGSFWPTLFGPELDKLGWEPVVVKNFKNSVVAVWKIFEEVIQERLDNFGQVPLSKTPDFIDSFLQRRKDLEEDGIKKSGFIGSDSIKRLRGALMDMNLGGNGTVSLTFEWALAYLISNPDVQDKIREELNKVLGPPQNGRVPTLSDRHELPFVEATGLEILRMSTPAALIVHFASTDTKVRGYFIPKGSYIMGNLYEMNHSKKVWNEPMKFQPERFICKQNGKSVIDRGMADSVQTFSIGKRKCPGQPYVTDTVFLLLANVFHRFQVRPGSSDADIFASTEPIFDFFLKPQNEPNYDDLLIILMIYSIQ